MLKNKRFVFLVSFILMFNSIFANTMIPIRDLANNQNATVTYTKENGVGLIEYTKGDIKLILNLESGIVVTNTGKIVNIPIQLENGITYVSSEEFNEIIQKEQGNREKLKSILEIIYDVINNTYTSLVNIKNSIETTDNTSYEKNTSNSSSSVPSNTGTNFIQAYNNSYITTSSVTTAATYEIVDIHVRDVWFIPAKVTTDGAMVAEGKITTSSTYGAKKMQWVACGVKSNKDSFKTYTFKVNPEYYFEEFGFVYKLEDGKTSVIGYLGPIYSPGSIMHIKINETGYIYEIPYNPNIENDILYYGDEEVRELSNKKLEEFIRKGIYISDIV